MRKASTSIPNHRRTNERVFPAQASDEEQCAPIWRSSDRQIQENLQRVAFAKGRSNCRIEPHSYKLMRASNSRQVNLSFL